MKTLSDHAEDIRRERTERLEADIQAAAAQRLAADAERERYAALAAEVGLPPDAPPAEVTRLHNLRKEQFWSEFVNSNTASADTRLERHETEEPSVARGHPGRCLRENTMADHFVSLTRGLEGEKQSDFTTGAASSGTTFVEVRVGDTAGANVPNRIEVIKALQAFERFFLNRFDVPAGFVINL